MSIQSVKVGNDSDSIFEAWFHSIDLGVSKEKAKIIFDAGVGTGKALNLIMPVADSRLRVYTQPVIEHEEKILLTA